VASGGAPTVLGYLVDGGQEIVEIVRDAAGKPADDFYFLGMEQLRFEALVLINLLAQQDFTLRYGSEIAEQRDFFIGPDSNRAVNDAQRA
jgi:hypothetical protein